jgi:UDP-N-acetylglucosamine--N-acetylmuramyl-(pentapeptide) pyrophosphoryl-undecaprenol N-acetylglucosamine transferase
MRYLFVSGGSGGHLAPLLAVGRALKTLDPEADILYACADQEADKEFLTAHRVTFSTLAWPRRAWTSPSAWIRNIGESTRLLLLQKPDAVFSKGGSISLPTCIFAWAQNIPVVLHESDAVWGRANRMAMRVARKVCLGFPTAQGERLAVSDKRLAPKEKSFATRYPLPATRSIVTGNPVRPEVTRGNRAEGLKIARLEGEKPVLLVMGGSQGAQALNEIVAAKLDELLAFCDVIHLTGKGKPGASVRAGYFATEFAVEELPHLYAASTIALSRSGAGSIAELAAVGIPTMLIPLRGVAQDHQLANALAAKESGGCDVLDQETLAETLVHAARSLLEPSTLEQRRTAMRSLHHADAAETIAGAILDAARRRR